MGSETEINSAEGGEGTSSVSAAKRTVSVVIAAHNAERTLGPVLHALESQNPPLQSVIVVDDGSEDGTAEVGRAHGATVIQDGVRRYAGGARNRGWDAADGDIVVFLDSDAVPSEDWSVGLHRALEEFPGAIVGCARTFTARTAWGWVAHLQIETPYLPRGLPRSVPFVSSYCMAVPRDAPLRWDESYGGEDGLFCIDAQAAGLELVFDPRFTAKHIHERETFADLRRQQQRMAYGFARCGPAHREGVHKRLASRLPLHYFTLVRLPLIYRRLGTDAALRSRFRRELPRLILAEWTYGLAACKYVIRRPELREDLAAS